MKPNSALPPTEARAPGKTYIDAMNAREIVDHMNRQDAGVTEAVSLQAEVIAVVTQCAANALQQGGRLVYVGAGTSGRLGVLDASECPPTFGVAPERVVGIIAGGDTALRTSVEGVEDDVAQAVADVRTHNIQHLDLVVGIAASGTTPYVLAFLDASKSESAATALVCCNPGCTSGADTIIALDTGPEVLAGSTRLKAGTATKMVLNMVSTGALALSGYVHDGLMVGMAPANAKLRHRAVRMVADLVDVELSEAEKLLDQAGNRIAVAVVMGRGNMGIPEAKSKLAEAGGILSRALETIKS
jgi:N-acetylmuramic acid 6-phosphate etherase